VETLRRILSIFLAVFCLAAGFAADSWAVTLVPPGNRNATQPAVPGGSTNRTRAGRTTFDAKYEKVRDLLASDQELISKIKSTARAYGIDPIHIVGAIVGEHTYNVDAYDRLQMYYVKAAAYAGNSFRFAYNGENVDDFVNRPQFAQCATIQGSYKLWICRENVWNKSFRGKTVGGEDFPNNRFSAVFFQPFYAGQTFGLGQINPLTALELSDLVSRVSGYPALDEKSASKVYDAIMDPDKSLAFIAASIKMSIADYRSIAGMDISNNPGLTATLYNVGNPTARAGALAAKNRARAAKGEAPLLPEENYYGWLVNDKLAELKGLL
jgi:hypothetical protein